MILNAVGLQIYFQVRKFCPVRFGGFLRGFGCGTEPPRGSGMLGGISTLMWSMVFFGLILWPAPQWQFWGSGVWRM